MFRDETPRCSPQLQRVLDRHHDKRIKSQRAADLGSMVVLADALKSVVTFEGAPDEFVAWWQTQEEVLQSGLTTGEQRCLTDLYHSKCRQLRARRRPVEAESRAVRAAVE
jgi:hypothetical protein